MKKAYAMWTKPYFGIQHLGDGGTGKPWVTVSDYSRFAMLHCWFPGCQFSPEERSFATIAEACRAGERWMRDRNCLSLTTSQKEPWYDEAIFVEEHDPV